MNRIMIEIEDGEVTKIMGDNHNDVTIVYNNNPHTSYVNKMETIPWDLGVYDEVVYNTHREVK